ncbi:MAG: hypothetical protein LQ339_001230 [Xanthoria mediterranea]|nr:MAG: hypothetical protein LQ339_001230 [Xanthoria mediterranea]
MGASSTRKEVRKRKFGTAEPSSDPATREKQHEPSPAITSPKDTTLNPAVEEKGPSESPTNDTEPPETKPHRFVVFVGNLPYSATDASIQRHFGNLNPTSIRHLHDKTTGKSKGYAFLEFDAYDRLKTCLKTFHQSKFDDGVSPARPLNVELTAGGGGSKSKDRRVKLKVKNERLRQERERRALELAKSEGKSVAVPNGLQKKKNKKKKAVGDGSDHPDIHPSRRARVGV